MNDVGRGLKEFQDSVVSLEAKESGNSKVTQFEMSLLL